MGVCRGWVRVASVIGCAAVLAACGSASAAEPGARATTIGSPPPSSAVLTATRTSAAVTNGQGLPTSAIPWASVGPGWFVALWGPKPGAAEGPQTARWVRQPTTLYLVAPNARRYRITTWPAPAGYQLLDWSGDGRRVLVLKPTTGTPTQETVEVVDLRTGGIVQTLSVPTLANALFTRPTGKAVLVWSDESTSPTSTPSFVRLSPSGAMQLVYPTMYPQTGSLGTGVLPSLDGTQVVVGATNGMALLNNNGTFVTTLGPSGRNCSPVRWWNHTEFLASCQPPSGSSTLSPALWLVPVNGNAPTQLTFPVPPDNGDVGGWQVGSNTYVQALGACGSEYLAKREANGSTTPVKVPNNARDDVEVVGAHGSQVALLARLACGAGTSLFWLDPVTAKEKPLLGPPLNGGGVMDAKPYPGLER